MTSSSGVPAMETCKFYGDCVIPSYFTFTKICVTVVATGIDACGQGSIGGY
jgi:hypothetical protein